MWKDIYICYHIVEIYMHGSWGTGLQCPPLNFVALWGMVSIGLTFEPNRGNNFQISKYTALNKMVVNYTF